MEDVPPAGPGVTRLGVADSAYPALLKTIPDPPAYLYARGDPTLLERPMLAMVGARRASAAGLQAAAQLAAAAAESGLAVCSGLALGIDAAAHRAALESGGATVAVLGTGIDVLYPRRNRALAEAIAARGCLVTELPPGEPPNPWNFPKRNRIISGLSLGVVVIEAALRSGSLITARLAAEQGREVFALPWSNAHAGGAGCLALLRDGAKMVQGIEDVIEELPALYRAWQERQPGRSPAPAPALPVQPPLLDLIGDGEVSADQLIRLSGLGAADVLSQLSALEMSGEVCRGVSGYRRSK